MNIKNRIVEVRKMRLGDIKVNPRNPKVHTDEQKETLEAVLREQGWAGVPLAYMSERNGGELTYVDGNMRGSEYPDLIAEVAITDLSDSEADYALLTYDPIAQMAEIAMQELDTILREVHTEEEAVQKFLTDVANSAGLYQEEPPTISDLETELGEPDEKDFWPIIRAQVSPETYEKYRELIKKIKAKDISEKFSILIEAVDESVFEESVE